MGDEMKKARNMGKGWSEKKERKEVSVFFFSSRRRHTRYWRDWSSDVCSSDLRIRFAKHLLSYQIRYQTFKYTSPDKTLPPKP